MLREFSAQLSAKILARCCFLITPRLLAPILAKHFGIKNKVSVAGGNTNRKKTRKTYHLKVAGQGLQ